MTARSTASRAAARACSSKSGAAQATSVRPSSPPSPQVARLGRRLDLGPDAPIRHDGRWWAADFYRRTVFTYDGDGREEPVLEAQSMPSTSRA